MNLEITKERVLEASEQSSEVKEALKTLFPEAFKPQNIIIESFEVNNTSVDIDAVEKLVFIGEGLAPHHLRNKCLMLSKNYNWGFEKHAGYTTLIPTIK